jgi:predicted dehydrogenase
MKHKVIQVGVGGWGATWLGKVATSPTWELSACVDVGGEALSAARAAHGIPRERSLDTVQDAVAETGAEAVLVVVPPQKHLAIAAEAFEAGLHVLVESR